MNSNHNFEAIKHEELSDVNGEAIEMLHVPSGTRLLALLNDDPNKSFGIGFKTPPKDDTGVFHIIEHSVLCGSRKFPVKEPFVELLKSSMQTFLNAMTFTDKTLYPVASTNEKDLYNLMDVYLDAVFHPNIYIKPQIFEQEGWHLELNDEGDAIYNGVVYNEMRGVLSDAFAVLYSDLQSALFPDTCYTFESGGQPESIPSLSYEEFLDEHARHYRTDNSYIFLYGDLDLDRALAFLDEKYLSPVAKEQKARDEKRKSDGLNPLVPREITLQEPVSPPHHIRKMKIADERACSACGYVVGKSSDIVRGAAAAVLMKALFEGNEAPLKRAILDAGLAHEVYAYPPEDPLIQPFVMIVLQVPAAGAGEKLDSFISEKIESLVENGIDRSLVEAAISNAEFQAKEHDLGDPDGVIYAMESLSSWLYNDNQSTAPLHYTEIFAELRKLLDNGYFEQLATELFCKNSHKASVEVVATPSDDVETTAVAFTPDEEKRISIEEKLNLLREHQETPDDEKSTSSLPRLALEDAKTGPVIPTYALDPTSPIPCVVHDIETRGLVYADRYFDLEMLDFEDMPYVSILADVLGELDTSEHSAAKLNELIRGKLGKLSFSVKTFASRNDRLVKPRFVVRASALEQNASFLASLPREVLSETIFSDKERILEVLRQCKIGMEHSFANAGHTCAMTRLMSYYSKVGVLEDAIANVSFYGFLTDLIDNFDELSDDLCAKLSDIAEKVFCDNSCMISFAGSKESYQAFWKASPGCGSTATPCEHNLTIPDPVVCNEAFIVPNDVTFTAVGWDRNLLDISGSEHSGAWLVASQALSFDYLWNEVRVKGGAYGSGFKAVRSGNAVFYSYRDPHIDETLDRFEKTADWLISSDMSKTEFEGLAVSTLATLDAPVKPHALMSRQMTDLICGYSPEYEKQLREQVLAVTQESIRDLAPVIREVVEKKAVCTFGSRAIIEDAATPFEVVELLG